MNLKKSLQLVALFLCTYTSQAQYTETINSNRPGTSQGAFAVGNQVLQFETGVGMGWDKHTLLAYESDMFIVDYAIRYGLVWEQLEINFMGSYVSEDRLSTLTAVPQEVKISNFRSNTLGLKYLIYDPYKKRALENPNLYSWHANNSFRWRELIPAIAIFAGVNFDNKDNPYIPPSESLVSPKVMVSTQNNLEGGWVFVTNIIADRIGQDFPTYSYILTLTHAFNERVSAFVENQGIKSDFYADQILRFGGAYLISNNLQADILASLNFKDTPSKYFAGIGVSYRIDMHSVDEIIEDKNSKEQSKRDKKNEKNRKDKVDPNNLDNYDFGDDDK